MWQIYTNFKSDIWSNLNYYPVPSECQLSYPSRTGPWPQPSSPSSKNWADTQKCTASEKSAPSQTHCWSRSPRPPLSGSLLSSAWRCRHLGHLWTGFCSELSGFGTRIWNRPLGLPGAPLVGESLLLLGFVRGWWTQCRIWGFRACFWEPDSWAGWKGTIGSSRLSTQASRHYWDSHTPYSTVRLVSPNKTDCLRAVASLAAPGS